MRMPLCDRRDFLSSFGGLAVASMLARDGWSSEKAAGGVLHHPAKAKRVVQLFMSGAASHVDLWDYKPELEKHHGKPSSFGEYVEVFQNGLGPWLKSPWSWKQYGNCGKHLSEITAPMGDVVDEVAFVHNMVGKTGVHSQATLLQATGFQVPGFPGMGAWISYGLGSMNDNLPTFVVLPDHRGFGPSGPKNWSAGFLPALHQGTVIRPGVTNPIADLFPDRAEFISRERDRKSTRLNSSH